MERKIADTLLLNGKFLTMESRGDIAEAVAIADKYILFVGNKDEAMQYADQNTKIID